VPPNIVLIVMDTARADAFEPWGAHLGASPTIADLARRGQSLGRVRSTANWTVPGHASMFSGELPRTLGLGIVENWSSAPAIAAARDKWLPEVLRRHGYATSAVSANLWISKHGGFDLGFDRFESVVSPRHQTMGNTGLRARLGWAHEGARARADDGAGQAEAILAGWLDHDAHRPFFWFVNLTECHSPYLPPRPYNDLGLLRRIHAADQARGNLTLEAIWKTSLGGRTMNAETLDRMRHLYQRSVLAMDDWVGRLLARLETHGLIDDTIVIVTSDHGENFGEGGLIGHCFSLDDRLLHVPFVSSHPGFADPSMSSLSELPGTIARSADITGHPWDRPVAPSGVAVAQMEAVSSRARVEEIVGAWGLDDEAIDLMTTSFTCATEGTFKLVRRDDGLEHLYQLDLDPLESSPIALNGRLPDAATHTVTVLRSAIDAAAASVSRTVRHAADLGLDESEVERIERKMRELGYL
jgi:arylsulfatase A-like enzyme